jgi:ligand-binding sensor domain-containing protein
MKIKIDFFFFKPFFLVNVLFFSMMQIFAQSPHKVPSFSPDKHITQFAIDIWDTEQGLPSMALLYLEQTSDGYLWISSFQGLFRFDGVSFHNFNDRKVTDGLHTNAIKDLFEQEDGTLYISTSEKGLVTYKNGKFESVGYLEVAIQTVLFDTPNHAWIGAKSYGVYELNDTTFTPYTKTPALKDIRIADIVKDNKHNIWFATEGNGLIKLDKEGKSTVFTTKDGLASDKVGTIFQDSQDKIWIGTAEGLCFFEGNEIKTLAKTESHSVTRILEDYYGSLWMASETGIMRRNIKTQDVEILTEKNGLPHKNVQDILLDNEGNIWFAMYRAGLGRIKEGKFSNYTHRSGLASKSTSAIHEFKKNDYLIATDASGIINRVKDNKVSVFDFKTELPNNRLKHINSDSQGNVLVSTYSGLLIIYADGREKLYNEQNGLPENQVRMTFEDHLGNIWIGTRASGLIKMTKDGTFSYYTRTNSKLSSNFIMSIHQDKNNNLLVGHNNTGLDVINIEGNLFDVKNYKKELTGNLVFNSYTDDDNVTWTTGNSGINRLENGEITQITINKGLPTDICYDLIEDDIGYFWISTNIGIMRVPKETLNNFAKGKIAKITSLKVFNDADGMITTECTGASFSIKAKNGTLMFPTLGGITFIDPKNISVNN